MILAVCKASVDLSDCDSEDAVYKRILARLNAGRR